MIMASPPSPQARPCIQRPSDLADASTLQVLIPKSFQAGQKAKKLVSNATPPTTYMTPVAQPGNVRNPAATNRLTPMANRIARSFVPRLHVIDPPPFTKYPTVKRPEAW